MLVLSLGLMATIITAGTTDRDAKIASCVELSQARLDQEDARTQAALDSSPFTREQVLNKIVISMIRLCVDTISLYQAKKLVLSDDDSDLISNLDLVPFPEQLYKTAKDIELTHAEKRVLSEVQELMRQSDELNEEPTAPSEAESPVLGVVSILLVLGGLIALGIYGVKRMRKVEVKKKKSR